MKPSQQILNEDDKKYLRRFSRYIQSYGMQHATIRLLELEEYPGFDYDDINFDEITHLSNNYQVEVPEGLIPIIRKMVEAGMKKMNNTDFHIDYINYGGVDIEISIPRNEISLEYYHSYTERGNSEGVEWSVEEDPKIKELFDLITNNIEYEPIMKIEYNGGGDSGYLEERFDNGESIPASVGTWCERELSGNFGGWENNEGADGYFEFDMNNQTINLVHNPNYNESQTITLSEDEFGK